MARSLILAPEEIRVGMVIISSAEPDKNYSFQSSAYEVKAVQLPLLVVKGLHIYMSSSIWDTRRHTAMLLTTEMLLSLFENTPATVIARQEKFIRGILGIPESAEAPASEVGAIRKIQWSGEEG